MKSSGASSRLLTDFKAMRDLLCRRLVRWGCFDQANCIGFALGANAKMNLRSYSPTARKEGITRKNMPDVLRDMGLTPLADSHIKKITIPADHYLIAVFIDKIKFDYHAYRYGPDHHWHHKQVTKPVTDKDAQGKIILDPRKAARNYRRQRSRWVVYGHHYTDFVCFCLVPNGIGIALVKARYEKFKTAQRKKRKAAGLKSRLLKRLTKKAPTKTS